MKQRLQKITLLLATLVAALSFIFIEPAYAGLNLGLDYTANIGLGQQDLRVTIVKVINAAFGFLGVVAVAIVLYGGFVWMTATGDEGKVQRAKDILRNGVIGLLIILAAASITNLIFGILGYGNIRSSYDFRPTGVDEYEGGSGALGNGIIQTHYPPRNAVDVARNTSIIITFKESVAIDQIFTPDKSLADCYGSPNANPPVSPQTCLGPIKELSAGGTFEIFSNQINEGDPKLDVTVSTFDGGKTFIFKPDTFLGSPDFTSTYAVTIQRGLKKFNNDPAFSPSSTRPLGYSWQFEVSTRLDVTPPTIESILPPQTNISSEKVDRNHLIQINFSEPVNPATISGEAKWIDDLQNPPQKKLTFLNIQTSANDGLAIQGRYEYSNNYQTVEFFTDIICGKNSCGNDVFCLPGDSDIKVLTKSATVYSSSDVNYSATLPFAASLATGNYDGVVDLAGNALDGNKNGTPQNNLSSYSNTPAVPYFENYPIYGESYAADFDDEIIVVGEDATHILTDDYLWRFFTNNNVDLTPPLVNAYNPIAGQQFVSPREEPLSSFDKFLSSSTVKSGSNYGDGYCVCDPSFDNPQDPTDGSGDCFEGERCSAFKGYCVEDTETVTGLRVSCVTNLLDQCKTVERPSVETRYPNGVTLKDVCIQKEYVTLDQDQATDENNQTWYTANKKDNRTNPNPELWQTDAYIKHGLLLSNEPYGVRYGSGIMDIRQNCYTPNAAPGCIRVESGGAGEFSDEGACSDSRYNNNRSACLAANGTYQSTNWFGLYPTCDLTTSTFGTEGNFNFSYADNDDINQLLKLSAFSWNKSPSEIYNPASGLLNSEFSFFEELLKPQTINYALYFDQSDDSYYLIILGASEIPTTTLAESVAVGDTEIKLTSTQGMPEDGSVFINNIQINYVGRLEDGTLTNVSGVIEELDEGSEVLIAVPRFYEFSYGVLGSESTPILASSEFQSGLNPREVMSWSGVPGDVSSAFIQKIGAKPDIDTQPVINLIFKPQEESISPLKTRFVYPGGVVEFDGTKEFSLELK